MRKLPFLTEEELHEPALRIIYALRKIHRVGFLHNDVTPSNILVTRKYVQNEISTKVKLSGLSKTLPIELAPQVQDPPTSLYSAPEVITEGKYSVESDIWALGATLFTLANGYLPFKNQTEILTKRLDWSNRKRGPFDPNFVQIVSEMLNKDAAQRPSLKQIWDSPYF